MITREKIVDSIDYVVNQSNYVSINKENISSVLPLLSGIRKTSWLNSDVLDLSKLDEEQVILYFLLCESFNFCFWDSDIKWKIEYHGEWYSGSYGVFYAVARAIETGKLSLDVSCLEKLTIEDLDDIFYGTTSIPLLKERFDILQGLVQELKNVSSLTELFDVSTDIELLDRIVSVFHNYRDISLYHGKEVYFFKRAILLVGDLSLNVDSISKKIKDNNQMLGCADYKIPQVLRHFGILEYSKELSLLVDSKQEIPKDSDMEIEIRANMLYCIELIKEKLVSQGKDFNSVEIDNALWLLSKNPSVKDRPHHLTRTTNY